MGSPMRGSRTGLGLAPLSGFAASTQSRAEGDDVYLGLINIVIEAFRHFLGVCVRFSVSLSLSFVSLCLAGFLYVRSLFSTALLPASHPG